MPSTWDKRISSAIQADVVSISWTNIVRECENVQFFSLSIARTLWRFDGRLYNPIVISFRYTGGRSSEQLYEIDICPKVDGSGDGNVTADHSFPFIHLASSTRNVFGANVMNDEVAATAVGL